MSLERRMSQLCLPGRDPAAGPKLCSGKGSGGARDEGRALRGSASLCGLPGQRLVWHGGLQEPGQLL